MTDAAFAEHGHALALELYTLLKEIDPIRWRDELAEACQERLAVLEQRVALLLESLPTNETLHVLLLRMQEQVRGALPELDGARDLRARWMSLRAALQPTYEQLADGLKEWDVHVPALRPTNHARSVFHFASSAFVILAIETVVHTPARMLGVALFFAVLAWTLEVTRRRDPAWNDWLIRAFGPLSHPHERYRVNSGTWYITALVALALTGSQVIGVTALAVLGVADPFAALIGRRWGRVKLLHGRTIEGTAAFFVAGTVAAFLALRVLHPAIAAGAALSLAAAAAFGGGIAELFSRRIDDNFTIPTIAGAAAWGVARLFGLI